MNNLGSRIKFLRDSMDMTQQDLGNIVGLHGSNIGRIENGKVFPTADILLKIATHFNVSCDWLMMGENAETHICDNADETNLIRLYRQLSLKDKEIIQELIEFKLYKAEKGKNHNLKSSGLTNTEKNNLVG